VKPDLRGAKLVAKAPLSGANLCDADLQGASLSKTYLTGARLSRAMLAKARLSYARISKANLSGANLYSAVLYGANLAHADLSGVDLSWAILSSADLCGANLSKATLRGARLSCTRLSRAILSEADLSKLDLRGLNFRGADLSGADLRVANLQSTRLDGATLTDAKLWETLRAGWSVKRVACARVFWDKDAKQPTEYADGEFERHHSEQQVIELLYKGGISRFELNTLPALIHHLGNIRGGCVLRLKSVEDAPGGTKVSIVVEEAGITGFEELKQRAFQLQSAQLELRDEKRRREQLEIEKALLLDTVFPRLLAAVGTKTITVSPSAPVGAIILDSSHVDVTSHQTITDPAVIEKLLQDISSQRATFQLRAEQLTNLEKAIETVQIELRETRPDTSIVRAGLNTIRNVFEGAVGSTIATAWWPALNQLLQTLR